MNKNVLVTGGAGFIGSSLVRILLEDGYNVVVLDALTYAGSLENLAEIEKNKNYTFIKGNINDQQLVLDILNTHQCGTVYHLAAESHVDNSISGPRAFIETNVTGTLSMLEASREYWTQKDRPDSFRFIHVSTDEVFGQLTADAPAFNEETPYQPNSPYSASKAASDHLANAWSHTYRLPVIITNCSNNFGPRQHKEKLIPTVIRTALGGQNIPVYGNGKNIRDWLFVDDHSRGLILAAHKGKPGQSYCLGGGTELQNIDLVRSICITLDELHPRADKKSYQNQITFVEDRPGHDWRYAIDCTYAEKELGYKPLHDFKTALNNTTEFYAGQMSGLQKAS